MQAQELIHSAESTVSQKQGGYWPEIMAKGSYNTYNTEHDTTLPMDQWQVSVGIDWQFFSGLRTKGEVAEAKSNLRTIRAKKRDTELLSVQEVTDSYYLAEEKRASVFLADKILKLAEENMEIADERYKTGLGDMIEFNDAQVRLTKARSNLVTTFFAYNTALARLDFAVGIYPDLFSTKERSSDN
jgi:outer membrane protein